MIKFGGFMQSIKNKIRGDPDNGKKAVRVPLQTNSKNGNNIKKQIKKPTKMTMFNYGVGGSEVVVDANEAIKEIQENKTLLVSKMTTNDSYYPEIVTGLKSIEEVFQHFKPSVSVDYETDEGPVREKFSFKNLGDFTPKELIQNSPFLKNLSIEQEQYNNIIRQLRKNKVLGNILANDQTKAALVEALKAVASELENNK